MVPTQISCPHFFPSGFSAMGQVFSGLRLTAFDSVVSGSSTLRDFSRASFFSNVFMCMVVPRLCLSVYSQVS